MKYDLKINDTTVEVTLRKHHAAKKLSLKINSKGIVAVTMPKYIPYKMAKLFASSNKSWIEKQLKNISLPIQQDTVQSDPLTRVKARNLIRSRLEYFNTFYNYTFHRITIRDQKTRWGSCSSDKTLSFNYRLALLPIELVDYVVVHELCHLKEMNHSYKFWDLVSKKIPDYPILRKRLHSYEKSLF